MGASAEPPLRGRLNSPSVTLALVNLAVLFAALDQTVVVTVLPQVMVDLKVPPTELDRAAWIVTGYLLGYTVAIPLMARLADVYGHARLFRAALVLFAVGSALVALASSLSWLVAARVLQALGGGATVPMGMALAGQTLPWQRRAVAVGLIGASAEAGVVLGPLYGGGITALLDWRWLFWLNLPLAALLLLALGAGRGRGAPGARVDYLGGLLLAAALTLLVTALARRDLFAGPGFFTFLLGSLGLAAVGALVWAEARTAQPLLSRLLLRSRVALAALTTKLVMGAALLIAMVTVPLMANALGHGPLEGGLRLMRLTGALPFGALAGGFLASRLGPRSVTLTGLAVAASGLFLMSRWDAHTGDPWLSVPLAVAGLGFGLVIAPVFATAMDAVAADYQATAASLVTVARMMGMALGMAALSAWGVERFLGLTEGLLFPLPQAGEATEAFTRRLQEYQEGLTQASVTLFQGFFQGAMGLLLGAMLPALGLPGRRGG